MNEIWIYVAVAAAVLGLGAVIVVARRTSGGATLTAPTPAPVVAPATPQPADVAAPPSFRDRLARARGVFAGATTGVLRRSAIDQSTWDELEEAMLRADLGVKVTMSLLDSLRDRVKRREITEPSALIRALRNDMVLRLADANRSLTFDASRGTPNIWLMVGVNGAGKTTSLAKIAAQQITEGRSVLMAAGDTFRAAAGEQLETWATRTGAAIVRGAEGADPSSVVFDGVQSAAARNIDLVLADTAGRLQTNTNLMDELRKVRR
ncbi:MAG: signal recognition particle receptor subunit alpha, partial [Actinomycetota bacterium]